MRDTTDTRPAAPTPVPEVQDSSTRERSGAHVDRKHGTPPHLRLTSALIAGATVCVEVLPVAAWLQLLASLNGPATPAALPTWWMIVITLVAWSFAAALRNLDSSAPLAPRARWMRRVLYTGTVITWLAAALASLLLSPAAYTGTALTTVPGVLIDDLAGGSVRPFSSALVLALVLYFWWRGMLLGRSRLSRERVYMRMVWATGGVIAAIAVAGLAGGVALRQSATELTLLLCAVVFAGLLATALAYIADTARERWNRRASGVANTGGNQVVERSWVLSSIGISGIIVAAALVIGLLLSYDVLNGLREMFQPALNALGSLLFWIIEAVAYVLFFFLGGLIQWLQDRAPNPRRSQPPQPLTATRHPQGSQSTLPPVWLTVATWVVIVLAAIVIVWLLVRFFRRMGEQRELREFEEERHGLSISGIVGDHLRRMFDSLFTRTRGSERLAGVPPGSIRAVYQTFLRAAQRAGITRRRSETADEFASRVAHVLREGDHQRGDSDGAGATPELAGLADTLTHMYDAARYGPEADQMPEAPPEVREVVHALEEHLRRVH